MARKGDGETRGRGERETRRKVTREMRRKGDAGTGDAGTGDAERMTPHFRFSLPPPRVSASLRDPFTPVTPSRCHRVRPYPSAPPTVASQRLTWDWLSRFSSKVVIVCCNVG